MHFYNKYLSGQWTDARIILDDGRKFDVHKIILSTVPYFDSLFSAEGMNESTTGDVTLHNVSSHIMDLLIEYIYKRDLRVNAENAAELFVAGDMLQISPLVGKCLEVLLDNLDVYNCVELLNMAEFFDTASCLHAPVLDFISRKLTQIPEENFEALTKESLISILTREQLAVDDEMILFRLLMTWVSDDEERSRDLHHLLKLVRFGTVSQSNGNHIMGHPTIVKNKKCRKMVRKFIARSPHDFFECQIPRTPISFVCLTENSDVAIGYRKQVNGWSFCNFTLKDVNVFVAADETNIIKLTDGKFIYTILSAKDAESLECKPILIQTDFSTRKSTKLSSLPFAIAKDQAACCYEGKLYVFNGIRKGENPSSDAFKYDVERMTWTEICIPEDVLEPFYAIGHRGKIYLSQQFTQSLHVLDVDTDTWTRTPPMHRPHVRAMYAALGDFVYVIGGAKSCREVEKLDITTVESAWKHCPTLPKHVYGENLFGGPKKLILNYIGAALTFDKKIYIFLDSREMYFDYTSSYLSEEENAMPSKGAAFVFDDSASLTGKWLPFRFAPVPFIKPFVFVNNLNSFITGSDDYQ